MGMPFSFTINLLNNRDIFLVMLVDVLGRKLLFSATHYNTLDLLCQTNNLYSYHSWLMNFLLFVDQLARLVFFLFFLSI